MPFPKQTGKENIEAYCIERKRKDKERREKLKAAGICTSCAKRPIAIGQSICYCESCLIRNRGYPKGGTPKAAGKGVAIRGTSYHTWPGQSIADARHCLSCYWHGIFRGHTCCDYSQFYGNGMRGCPDGLACTRYVPTKKGTKAIREEETAVEYELEALYG